MDRLEDALARVLQDMDAVTREAEAALAKTASPSGRLRLSRILAELTDLRRDAAADAQALGLDPRLYARTADRPC